MRGYWRIIGIVVLCAVLAVLATRYEQYKNASLPHGGQPMLPTTIVTFNASSTAPVKITAELAITSQEEESGLSDRSGLAPNSGMLFVFDPPQVPGFWMKDMLFSLDILYIAQDGTIVTIVPNLSPATYPDAFHPTAPVQYVLEVPAGFAANNGIAVGQKVVVQ